MENCKWVAREGTGRSLWAYTTCKKGFNPLTRVSRPKDIKDAYNGRLCPICGKPIEISTWLVEDDDEKDSDDTFGGNDDPASGM